MEMIFCTLFDSAYLDKGLVLYDSMKKNIESFKLYVFAFDDKCESLLRKENKDRLIVVGLEEFETKELLMVKKDRTKAEYCWTCSPWIIKHVIEKYNEPHCTYIDADMMFFSSPMYLIEDMIQKNCSTLIVPHRYLTQSEEEKARDERGTYCVEFNTFFNSKDSLQALQWWAEKCLEWCFYIVPGKDKWYGDQKYLNEFPKLFTGVYICEDMGVGLAPWNTKLIIEGQYERDDTPQIISIKDNKEYKLVIYHFESVNFLTKNIVHAPSGIKSDRLRKDIYSKYINNIVEKRRYLNKKYNYVISTKRRIVTKKPLLKFYHLYILPIRRIKSIKDLYFIKWL